MKKRTWLILLGAVVLAAAAFLIYTGQYYRADADARAALRSDGAVQVTRTGYGWFFDGPSETEALVFYPGAKVEETAYAPLLRRIAEGGMDVCLIKMPFRLAVFGIDSAGRAMREHGHTSWVIGGHSLGGAMAAGYASRHGAELTGVVLLAAYSTKPLDDSLRVVSIFGSEDGVLDMVKLRAQDRCLPAGREQRVIEGGNHAQFGNYGRQRGDGDASISAEDQQRRTADLILAAFGQGAETDPLPRGADFP